MDKNENNSFDEDFSEDNYNPYEESKLFYHEDSKDVYKSYVPLAIGLGILFIIGILCLKYLPHNPYFK